MKKCKCNINPEKCDSICDTCSHYVENTPENCRDYYMVLMTTALEDVWLTDSRRDTEEEILEYIRINKKKLDKVAGYNGDYSYHLRDGVTGKVKKDG